MSKEIAIAEVRTMANSVVSSGLYGIKNSEQAFTLMLIAQAENTHPVKAMQMYDIIQGRPALKASEVLSRYQQAGGKIQWIKTDAKSAKAKFTHPQGGEFEYEYTIEDAQQAGLTGKDNWKKRPKEMLRARCTSGGVRMSYPACLNNMYSSDEVADMEIEEQENIQEVEVVEEQTQDVGALKRQLASKLRKLNVVDTDIKEFAELNSLNENLQLLEELVNDDKLLEKKLVEFEEFTGE